MKESKLSSLTKELFENYIKDGLTVTKIGKLFNVSTASVSQKAKKLGITFPKKETFDINIFDTIDTEEKAYWLGFLYADGCVYNSPHHYILSLSLKSSDYNHVKKFKDFLKDKRDNSIIKNSTISRKDKIYEESRYVICSKHLVEKLSNYGCIPRKSLKLTFPNENIFKEKNLIIDFIRGYIDGDGCLCKKHNRLYISILGTFEFLSGVKKYFPVFSSIRKHGNIYVVECGCGSADKIAMTLYNNATIYLDRKFIKFTQLCKLYKGDVKNLG